MVCWGRDSTTCCPKCKEWRTESRAGWMRLPMVPGAKVQIGLRPVQNERTESMTAWRTESRTEWNGRWRNGFPANYLASGLPLSSGDFQPLTANRYHLTWVGSGPRHDIAAFVSGGGSQPRVAGGGKDREARLTRGSEQ